MLVTLVQYKKRLNIKTKAQQRMRAIGCISGSPKYWDHFAGHGDLSNELEPRLFKFLNNCVQFDEKINMVINLFSNLKILKYNSVNGLNLLT